MTFQIITAQHQKMVEEFGIVVNKYFKEEVVDPEDAARASLEFIQIAKKYKDKLVEKEDDET